MSPMRWPSVSLTTLKRSRSRNITAKPCGLARPLDMRLIWSSVVRNTRRFGSPVSGSCEASRATCASASARLVMSVKVWTKLPSGRWPLRTSITVPFGMVRSHTANFSCSAGDERAAASPCEFAALRCLALRVWYSTSSSKRGGLLMNSPGRSSSSPQRPLMIGICRSLVTSMMPWLMFSSVSRSWSALSRAPSSVWRTRSIAISTIRVRTMPATAFIWSVDHDPL